MDKLKTPRGMARLAVFSAIVLAAYIAASAAFAHSTSAVLLPTNNTALANPGGIATWTANGAGTINESGRASCDNDSFISTSTDGAKSFYAVSLASIPDGATITSVDVQVFHRRDGGTDGGTFKTAVRFGPDSGNLTETAAAANISEVAGNSVNPCAQYAGQSIDVTDTVKDGDTVLQVGVVKTNADLQRVGAIRAVVTYNRGPSAPTLLSPADAASTSDTTPDFDWDDDAEDPDDGTFNTVALIPAGFGFHNAWANTNEALGNIDDHAVVNCATFISSSTTNQRSSFPVPLGTIPNGAVINTVTVSTWDMAQNPGGIGSTYKPFIRLDASDTDGSEFATTSNSEATCAATERTQVFDPAGDITKIGTTTLEVGVLKTATDTDQVRIGALRATVNYTVTETPFTYDFQIAPLVNDECDWDNAIEDQSGLTDTELLGDDLDEALDPGVYCWRVRALDHDDLAGDWSDHFELTILEEGVDEGCPAGDWKTDEDLWEDTGFARTARLDTVFEIPPAFSDLADDTLLEALDYGGGSTNLDKARILLRQAVAAILNASHPDINYPLDEQDIIEDVDDALADLAAGDDATWEELKDLLEGYNELGEETLCPAPVIEE